MEQRFFSWVAALHRGSILASHPAPSGLIPGIPQKISRKIIHVAEVNQRAWLEEKGQ